MSSHSHLCWDYFGWEFYKAVILNHGKHGCKHLHVIYKITQEISKRNPEVQIYAALPWAF